MGIMAIAEARSLYNDDNIEIIGIGTSGTYALHSGYYDISFSISSALSNVVLDQKVIDTCLSVGEKQTLGDKWYKPYVDAFGDSLEKFKLSYLFFKRLNSIEFDMISREAELYYKGDAQYTKSLTFSMQIEKVLALPLNMTIEQVRDVLILDNEEAYDRIYKKFVFLDKLSIFNHIMSNMGVFDYVKRLPEDERLYYTKTVLAGQPVPRLAITEREVRLWEE